MIEPLIFCSPSAADRRRRAAQWLLARGTGKPALIIGSTVEAASDLVREISLQRRAGFGWHRYSLSRLAALLAGPAMAERGLQPLAGLPLEALCARAVHGLALRNELGRLQPLSDRPGLPRALSRTVAELRLAGVAAAALPPGIGAALAAIEAELEQSKLADRALILKLAAAALRDRSRSLLLAGLPALLLDVPVTCALERDLISALCQRGGEIFATVPAGDESSLAQIERALGVTAVAADAPGSSSLARVQQHLFAAQAAEPQPLGDDVQILSAPGESRECVEIARRLLALAGGQAGAKVPFDRMAVLLRAPFSYRGLLEEALGRAGIPAHFARGTSRPDPAGRAFLALLACRAQELSASRFAEYLSLGEVPQADEQGAPPPAAAPSERFVPPEEGESFSDGNILTEAEGAPPANPEDPVQDGTLRAPRRWERLIVDAAVIGSRVRWENRLAGLRAELEVKLRIKVADDDEAGADAIRHMLSDLETLRAFALPLIDALVALPESAPWSTWLEALSALASRALRRPQTVQALLAELLPLGPVGPVGLAEVRHVLERRLTELAVPPARSRFGKVFVASIEAARGLAFDVVFVPGLAEKLFPPRLQQDPLLRDRERENLAGAELVTNKERLEGERLFLRLAAGAARSKLVLSYPRLDTQQARARVPSFYGLEVMRAATGELPRFSEFAAKAEKAGGGRPGWPAPLDARDAIDEAEHDLALLDSVSSLPDVEAKGTARYLVGVNPHLARALRARWKRYRKSWQSTDGLVGPSKAALQALGAHTLDKRSYSPTALQHFAACPYRFLLQAVHRLEPRDEPQRIDEIDPMSRGSLMHQAQFELLKELQRAGTLPLDGDKLPAALQGLERVLDDVAGKWKERLYPAIPRVWEDGVASVRADLRVWLARMAADREFVPWHFELSFGLARAPDRDQDSVRAPVPLDSGLSLKGSIDLVEQRADGHLRATDYKSGKKRASRGTVIGGGAVLQPVLYALALEKLFPGQPVDEGRLWYCTHAGEFETVPVPLDVQARESIATLARTLGEALSTGFLPAAPRERECDWCDYLPVCGPSEAQRSKRKPKERLLALLALRELP